MFDGKAAQLPPKRQFHPPPIIDFALTSRSIAASMTWLQRSTTIVRLKSPLRRLCIRCLATSASGAPFQVFNTETKRHQRDRAATLDPGTSRRTDYLRDEVATRLVERFTVFNSNTASLTEAHQSSFQHCCGLWIRIRTCS